MGSQRAGHTIGHCGTLRVGVTCPGFSKVRLYTDGITDANSPSGEFFGAERLREAAGNSESLDAQSLCDRISQLVSRFPADAVQYDDMAMRVAHYRP